MPKSATLKADYNKSQVIKQNISKIKQNPMGVNGFLKESTVRCELSDSLKPLSVAQYESTVSKNASVNESEIRNSFNI